MSKKYQDEQAEVVQSQEGVDTPAEQSDTGAEQVVEQSAEPEEQSAKPVALGIGAFVRHMLKNSTKSNSEILEMVLELFEGSKTTPACIAWYKTDMRKKGLLDGVQARGKNVVKEFSAERLAELTASKAE